MILQPYGTTIAVAVLVGAFVASMEAKRRGQDPQLIWEALPWVLVFGLVGARAYHVLHFLEFYQARPVSILFLWNGGLGIFGALVGGVVGLFVWQLVSERELKFAITKKKREGLLEFLDVAAPGIAVGQVIGRFANFFSQELYGFPTDLPWGIYIRPENRFPGLGNFEYFHPLFLYEALWCFLGFVLLAGTTKWCSYRRGQASQLLLAGERFLLYLSFYALGRFFLEGIRIESWMMGGVRVAQVVSVVIIFGSTTLAVVRRVGSKISNVKVQISNQIQNPKFKIF